LNYLLRTIIKLFLLSSVLLALLSARVLAADKHESEYELLLRFPSNALAAMTAGGQPDENGLVGFHKRNKAWYEAGMQRGGCWYLIGGVVAGDESRAEEGWKSIETTFAHQLDDGGFLSNPNPSRNHTQSFDERVETAFFYLQELGHAILVIRESPLEGRFHERIAALEPKISRACAFVQSGYDGIIRRSSKAANRIFIAAKAFGLCGKVLGNEEYVTTSRRLVGVALKLRDADGIFVENGGRDSSYNAVSLLMGQVLNLHEPDPELKAALEKAMAWQRQRILPTGEVLVAGNSRTGLGQEKSFDGGIKKVNYNEVALALWYFSMIHDDAGLEELAEKVRTWQEPAKN
jgi:hypothetical protein